MAVTSNLVAETSVSTGTANLTLANIVGRQPFNTAFGNGVTTNVFWYFISNASAAEWEVGTGHLSSASVLVRDTVIASTNANALVNFTTGTKTITSDIPASLQISGTVGTIDNRLVRSDGTADHIAQGSNVAVDDNGGMTGVAAIAVSSGALAVLGTGSVNMAISGTIGSYTHGMFASGTAGYLLRSVSYVLASGTYTTPTGCRALLVTSYGAGGGGGYAKGVAGQTGAGAGGASGSVSISFITNPAASYTVSVGAGGNGGTAASTLPGNSGGDTIFGASLATGVGGGPGVSDAGSTSPHATLGGIPLLGAGSLAIRGNAGLPGITILSTQGISGMGAGAPGFSAWSIARVAAANGTSPDANTGGGGSGGLSAAAVDRNGGAGSDGRIEVQEYF